jgi:enamine deaminase RidA (YjgF/YER057c/UK114 family)
MNTRQTLVAPTLLAFRYASLRCPPLLLSRRLLSTDNQVVAWFNSSRIAPKDRRSTMLQTFARAAVHQAPVRAFYATPPQYIRHLVEVPGTPPAGAFSRATVHDGLVYVSGTGASNDTGTGDVCTDGKAYSETRGALDHIETILREAGSGPECIVVATMLLTDKEDYAECNRAYVDFFSERGLAEQLPARSSAMWAVPTTAKVAFSVVAHVKA